MNFFKALLLLTSLLSFGCSAQEGTSTVTIVTPSINQEATSIWRTINDIKFLESQGYRIHLPVHPLMDSLILKSKKGEFGNEDFQLIYALLESEIYQEETYNQAYQKVEAQLGLIHEMLAQINSEKDEWDWSFKLFDSYQVVFTLYGTGGSYDPDEGIITILTNKEGSFTKYKNPAYTIIHEISHMGMEYSIVQKYKLAHGIKERLVDTFVYLMFNKQLPDYQIQNMGDNKLDMYLKTKDDIKELDAIISGFAQD